jgi:hypothetical protein
LGNYSVEKLPDEPIVISTAFPEWRAMTEWDPFFNDFIACIDACTEPVYYIGNLTEYRPDVQDVIIAANNATRSAKSILFHPNVKQFLLVTKMKLVEMAGNGLRSSTFGSVNIVIFSSLEEALAHARRNLA